MEEHIVDIGLLWYLWDLCDSYLGTVVPSVESHIFVELYIDCLHTCIMSLTK